jgi:hypothetical protein
MVSGSRQRGGGESPCRGAGSKKMPVFPGNSHGGRVCFWVRGRTAVGIFFHFRPVSEAIFG